MHDAPTPPPTCEAAAPEPATGTATFQTRSGKHYRLPLFLPVYQPRLRAFQLSTRDPRFSIEGLIVNSYFLYKQRDIRAQFTGSMTLSEFIGFDGLITTDSGAFQGFTRPLYLSNRDIIRFQDRIGSDVIAPLDLVTPPGDKRSLAQAKLETTNKRIQEGLGLVERGILAGVQQGGRFEDLRLASMEALLRFGVQYVAIGSLVPFFNRNHDISFAGRVVRDARAMMGPDLPMHIYGAGDPVEIPFFVALGATIFDSASYGHYAQGGYYMTPYGALRDLGPLLAGEYRCECTVCSGRSDFAEVMADTDALTLHNLWTIHHTIDRVRAALSVPGGLDAYLAEILEIHAAWFPTSDLPNSWRAIQS